MSVDYIAKTIIGVAIPKEKLFVKTKTRGCKHKLKSGSNFCNVCGKPLWLVDDEIEIEGYSKDNETLFGFPAIMSGDDGRYVFVGLIFCSSYNSEFTFSGAIDLEIIRSDLMKKLKPAGLWDDLDDLNFGVYTVLYCSY